MSGWLASGDPKCSLSTIFYRKRKERGHGRVKGVQDRGPALGGCACFCHKEILVQREEGPRRKKETEKAKDKGNNGPSPVLV